MCIYTLHGYTDLRKTLFGLIHTPLRCVRVLLGFDFNMGRDKEQIIYSSINGSKEQIIFKVLID